MRAFFTSLLLTLFVSASLVASPLLVNGIPGYVIAEPVQAHATEHRSAQELALYLEKITGQKFQVVPENAVPKDKKVFYVGQTEFAQSKGVDFAAFTSEEWLIKTLPDSSVILGGGKYAGIYYAVCDYLERQFGVRWLAEDCEIVPENPAAETGDWSLQRKPAFAVRQVFDLLDWSPTTGRFKEHNKGFSYTQEETGASKYYGGERPYHSAGDYCKDWPDKPELYSRDANGKILKPVPGGDAGGQLCLSNPEVRERVLKRMKEYIERDRKMAAEKQVAPPYIYDFSGNDNPNKCTCAGCMALAQQEGSYSGATIDFINWLAVRIGQEYPDVLVKTFAYMYCEEPPQKMHTEPNVMIHMALGGMEFGGSYAIYDTMRALKHPVNQKALERFQKWSCHTDHIMHWQYWTLYPIVPEPIVRYDALFSDIETDREYHIEAFFAEYENPAFNSFSLLTRYLTFKLTDDPDRDQDTMLKEFMEGYYGPAAEPMTKLLLYMDKRQDEFDNGLGEVEVAFRPYLDDEYFATTLGLLAEAEEAASAQPEILARIRREKPCLLSGLLSRWPSLKDTSRYDAPALIEEFRSTSYEAMDFFFKEDKNDFRKSEHFDETVERFCDNFRTTTAEVSGGLPLPAGVDLSAQEYLSLNAAQFLYEAKAKLVDDPAAYGGKTCVYEYGKDKLNLFLNNWMENIVLTKFDLTESILPRDGKYHWLEIGTHKFNNNGRAHLLIPDHCQGIRCEFYRRIVPGTAHKIYVSLKCDDKIVAMDRVLLLRQDNYQEPATRFIMPRELAERRTTIIPGNRFYSPEAGKPQRDDDAIGGQAIVNVNSGCSSADNTDFGIFDPTDKNCLHFAYPKTAIKDNNYHLVKAFTGKMPSHSGAYLFCGSDWQIQCTLPGEVLGKNGDLYVWIKFTGPRYLKGSSEADGFYVGGAIFAEEDNTMPFDTLPEIDGRATVLLPGSRFHSPETGKSEIDAAAIGGLAWVNTTPASSSADNTDFGIFNPTDKSCLAFAYPKTAIKDNEYHLVKAFSGKMPSHAGSYLFCGSDWQIQCPLPSEVLGQIGDLYVWIKFTGPRYLPGSTEENGFYVGGAVFVQ